MSLGTTNDSFVRLHTTFRPRLRPGLTDVLTSVRVTGDDTRRTSSSFSSSVGVSCGSGEGEGFFTPLENTWVTRRDPGVGLRSSSGNRVSGHTTTRSHTPDLTRKGPIRRTGGERLTVWQVPDGVWRRVLEAGVIRPLLVFSLEVITTVGRTLGGGRRVTWHVRVPVEESFHSDCPSCLPGKILSSRSIISIVPPLLSPPKTIDACSLQDATHRLVL